MKKIVQISINEKLRKADQMMIQKKYIQAITSYSKAVFLDKENSLIYQKMGIVYQLLTDYSTALNMYKKSYSLQNKKQIMTKIKQLLLKKGHALLQINTVRNILHNLNYQEFKNDYQDWALEVYNRNNSHQIRNAFAYIQTGNKHFALQQLNKLDKKDDDVDCIVLRGKINWALGRTAQGNSDFWKLKQIQPKCKQVVKFLNFIMPQMDILLKQTRYLLLQQRTDKCLFNIKKGLEMYPNNPDLLIMRSYINRNNKKFQASIQDLKIAKKYAAKPDEIDSQLAITYNQMGMAQFLNKQYQSSIQLFQIAIQIKPQEWSFVINLGDSHRYLQNIDMAISYYQKAAKMTGFKPQLVTRLAIVYCSKGIKYFNKRLLHQAKQCFSLAISFQPKNSSYYTMLGRTWLQMGQLKEASSTFQKALQLDPQNYQLLQLHKQISIYNN